jgi:Concanavalin A-like lectin/glucanases superfamily
MMFDQGGVRSYLLCPWSVRGLLPKFLLTGLLVAVLASAHCAVVARANPVPVAAYSFDEGSGVTVKDSAGNHTGTISGASRASVGKYDAALSFDGVNDLVSIADASDLDFTGSFTLEAWVNPTSTSASLPIISKGETAGGNSGYALSARYTSAPPAGIVADAGTLKSVSGPSALKTGEWSHLALTSDGTALRLYINGSLISSATAISAKATNAPLEVGHSFLGGYFAGLVDEVRLYNETLSESQIQTDRDTAVGLDQTPVAAYSFDEGSGVTVKDSAGNHTGTISGASWASVGKYDAALSFDGVNDLVSIADASDLDFTGSFTLEAWVNPTSTSASLPIISKGETAGGNSGYALSARYTSAPPAGIVADAGTLKSVSGPSALKTGEWSHLALTSDGTALRLYINGSLISSATAISAKATNAPLEVGHSFLGGYFAGLVDEVRLYNETLSESQIQTDRDNRVQVPAPQEVTTSVLDSGPSAEKVSSVPITASGTETVVYSLAIPSIKVNEVLRATGNVEVTNTHTYDVTDSVRLVLGSNASDGGGVVITPWTRVQHTKDMLHWTLPINGLYRASSNFGSTQYLKLVLKAASASAKAGETLTVQPNFGRLVATRYTPAVSPMSQRTYLLQSLTGPMTERNGSVPVDSTWRLILSRKVGELSVNDLLDLTGQLEVQNPNSVPVQLESIVKMASSPTTTSSTASPATTDRLAPGMSFARIVHTNQIQVADPGKRYMNLLVRAVPVSGTPSPLTVSAGSTSLNVMRMTPDPGEPSAPLRQGTLQEYNADFYSNVSSIPFAPPGGSQKRVVASAPLYGGLWKGEVIRARGLVTSDLNGGAVAQVLTQLILANSPTETTGDVLATLSGDKVPAAQQIHTSIKEGTYMVPGAESVTKYLNYVVYASQNPVEEGKSMNVPAASVSFTRSKPIAPLNEGFENGLDLDGLDSVFEYESNGQLSASSNVAREGMRSLLVDLSVTEDTGESPGVRRVEVRPPDIRSAAGYFGADNWHGFSAYFPKGFNAPSPPSAAHFDGLIDEVRLYNQALSENQVTADKNGSYGSQPTPVAAYSFNEGSGMLAHDSTGSHDGIVKEATWASGKYGSALSFNGTDSEVSVPDAVDLDFTSSFTLEAWVNPKTLINLVPAIAKSKSLISGYGLAPSSSGNPAGFVADAGTLKTVSGPSALKTGEWSHLALTSDGTALRLYINGSLISSAAGIASAPTDADLTIGGAAFVAPSAGTWNIFTQLHYLKEENPLFGCPESLGGWSPPISFNVRHYKAGAHTNPGETTTATPVEGDYIEVGFNGGEINASCQPVKNTATYVIAPLELERWYDIVLHTRWTTEEGGPGNSISEVWMDGKQVLGNQSSPVSTPTLLWRTTPALHNYGSYLQFGMYRGPSEEDPPVQLYIDAVRSGNSYSEVAPGQ